MTNGIVDKERLAFEKKKWEESLAIEKQKLECEKVSRIVSTAGVVIPLLIVAMTIYWNTHIQKLQHKADFDLKSAEVILGPTTVTESQNRADGLVALLPNRFPAGFSSRLEPLHEKLQKPEQSGKRALLNLLAAAPKERRKEILELWLAFYPTDRDKIPETVFKVLESP